MKIIRRYWVFLLVILFALALALVDYAYPAYVVDNPNGAMIAPPEIKRAILKMGPRYHYRLWPDGLLQVNVGDGKWLRLRY